ncbi:PREDICTED: uncharacterized protein LOC104599604 [Nelumbo nucifera]|uniref:Uncharacterized protein LOC104599604 n=2 Tax=Nelumbo nucifera TaxID=4432 RepID=A0A1U8Q4V7_NELNU|nr:PREDICTED: uncharacterized protein LOC104599604 [Nelumbo nucifera]DAD22824.1 TPA_asm: hypothetical protein HUJ06_024287 [Nelumbo nucifera]
MEGLWHEHTMGVAAETDFCDTFSSFGMGTQDQDQDEDRYSEFEFGHVIPEYPTTDTTDDHDESDFEFGCITPDSPANDPDKNYPADVLFYNGRLLPHAFPFQPVKVAGSGCSRLSRCTSSSVSSRDSFMSSRSNSSNSRSSCCSSARTSYSENSERRPSISDKRVAARPPITGMRNQANRPMPPHQRWQFIAPAPILTPSKEVSRRKKTGILVQEDLKSKKKVKDKKKSARSSSGWQFLRSFLLACRECHSLQPTLKENQ